MKLTKSMEGYLYDYLVLESTTTARAVLSTGLNSRRNSLSKRSPWLVTDDVSLPTRWLAPCSIQSNYLTCVIQQAILYQQEQTRLYASASIFNIKIKRVHNIKAHKLDSDPPTKPLTTSTM
ncbi:hypothetical protein BHYA_0108g00280 [Botrytis hyacinthi]|uniref:Uncharacterized protein n=1 Tax=Botrytis hyacinthi TaxID=278943 RepID=A0A4Z1GQQ4_9HELO|nr:hypothetical protein BHYA_0108g00280 [Botrytis hyacinthi]